MTANDRPPHDGGCSCGALRYRMTTLPIFVHCCHCRWCQRESGASFALNALIEADRVTLLQGQPWVMLPADTPAVAEYYDRELYWPQDSLERRRVLLAKTH